MICSNWFNYFWTKSGFFSYSLIYVPDLKLLLGSLLDFAFIVNTSLLIIILPSKQCGIVYPSISTVRSSTLDLIYKALTAKSKKCLTV